MKNPFGGWVRPKSETQSVETAESQLRDPGQADGLYLQQAGRILRPWEGVRPIILDHAGNAIAHGLPQDDRVFELDARPAKKGKRKEPATSRECERCGAVFAVRIRACPECGHEMRADLPEVDGPGQLVEIDTEHRARLKAEWDAMCTAWRAFNEMRVAQGLQPYKPGRVYWSFKQKFGCEPPIGCQRPAEMADDGAKRQAFRDLCAEAKARGYKPGWTVVRFTARFGHPPPRTRERRSPALEKATA